MKDGRFGKYPESVGEAFQAGWVQAVGLLPFPPRLDDEVTAKAHAIRDYDGAKTVSVVFAYGGTVVYTPTFSRQALDLLITELESARTALDSLP